MARGHRILLTTTSSVEGWEVTDYLGPVSAEFVIGTGLFTDFFSSWTDFFGAHSRAYEEKLDLINEEALTLIERKAVRLGANGVLGLRVDHDEISGAGKSMLMVTGSGTAVRLRRRDPSHSVETAEQIEGTVGAADLRILLQKRKLLDQAGVGDLQLGQEDTWRFIVENRIGELAPYVLNHLEERFDDAQYASERRERITEKYREFFLILPEEEAKRHLYSCLGRGEGLWAFALRVIQDGMFFDSERILAVLRDDAEPARHRSIQLVASDPPFYSAGDLPKLEALYGQIETAFPVAEIHAKTGVLGAKEVWKCRCGHEPKAAEELCTRCRRDRRGFQEKMLKPERALEILRRKIDVLKAELHVA